MPATYVNSKTQNAVQSPPATQTGAADARMAAVVQAAYILQARSTR